ncbi:vacuolar protein sorting-associated protein 37A-like [Styela clava]
MPKTTSSNVASQIAQTQKIRRKQIEKLKQLKLNVTMIQRDVQYQVDFILKHENEQYAYTIIIDLPPAFPSEAPMLFVHPPCSHKYLDAAQVVVSFPPLDNFKSKPDLSSVVKRLINEFEKNRPIPLLVQGYQIDNEMSEDYIAQLSEVTQMNSNSNDSTKSTSVYNGPKLPDVIPELDNLSLEELKDLDEDEIQLLGVFHSTEMSKAIHDEREEISKRIEKIAKDNLSRSADLEKCRENLVKSFDKCQKMKEEYDGNVKKFMEASEWMSLNNISLRIQVSTAEQEEKAEKMVENFLDGDMDVNDFTKEFVKSKTIAATRKAQEDKIQHILASQ